MQFEIEYLNELYLIEIDELKNDKKNKIVFNNQGLDDYEIKVFHLKGENIKPIKITEFSQDFQQDVGELLHSLLPKTKTYVANPFFDEVFIFYGNTIFTSQEKLKRINCVGCGRSDLYEKREKDNKTGFVKDVQSKLNSNPHPEWPFKEDLLVQISVSDRTSRLKTVDLDNLSKSIFDSLKGVVFVDDSQVVGFSADKYSVAELTAYIVAIKRLITGEKPRYQDYIFSGNKFQWDQEYQKKTSENKLTRFVSFK